MLRCRFSCTSTHASCYAAVDSLALPHMRHATLHHDDDDGDDDVDIADDTKVSFLSLFNSPLENVWKVTTVASLSDARHHVLTHVQFFALEKPHQNLFSDFNHQSKHLSEWGCARFETFPVCVATPKKKLGDEPTSRSSKSLASFGSSKSGLSGVAFHESMNGFCDGGATSGSVPSFNYRCFQSIYPLVMADIAIENGHL